MPQIKLLDGIKVEMFFRDHLPPHIHASYNEHEELIEINTFATYRGWLPAKQRRVVVDWMRNHQAFLQLKWEEFSG